MRNQSALYTEKLMSVQRNFPRSKIFPIGHIAGSCVLIAWQFVIIVEFIAMVKMHTWLDNTS